MSNIKISNLAGSDLFATEESFISELSTTDTNAILGGGHGKRGSGKGRRGSGKSSKRRFGGGSGKSSKRRFGGGSSRGGFGHGGGCGFGYCNPYCRT
jgi:hypothetical protein